METVIWVLMAAWAVLGIGTTLVLYRRGRALDRRTEALIAEDERRMREQSERFDASLDKWRDRMEGWG